MSRAITNVLSTGLDIYNCCILFIMIISLIRPAQKNKKSLYFLLICVSIFIFNFTDMATWFSEGLTPAWHVPYLHVSTFIFYFITPFIFYFLLKYIREYLHDEKLVPVLQIICVSVSIVHLILVILTPFFGFYYYFTPDNHYVRGKYNFLSLIAYVIFYCLSIVYVIIYRKYFKRSTKFFFISYPLIPLICNLIQIRFYGLSLVNTGMTLSTLLIFINLYKDLEFSYEKSEIDNRKKAKKIIQFQEQTIISLSNLCENRDIETGEHARRTSMFIEKLAQQTQKDGFYSDILTDNYVKLLVKAAPMHDIGKIVVSDTILKKKGRLNKDEYESMKEHTKQGGRIVQQIIAFSDDLRYRKIAIEMAQSHHERWDGTGYPNNLRSTEIPLSARFMAIADVFDALVFERCYKKPIPPDEAFDIIQSESSTHFDPILVSEFMKIKPEIIRIIGIFN